MKHFFKLTSIFLQGYRLAYVVFNSAKSLETALSWPNDKLITIPTNDNPLFTGLKSELDFTS